MKNLFKDSLNLLKYNSIFIQPVLIFFIVLSFIDPYLIRLRGVSVPFFVLLASLLLLFVAVQSGWFYINALAVKNADKKYESSQERYQEVSQTFGKFFVGVGESFLPTLVINIICLGILFGCSYLLFQFGVHRVGSPKVLFEIFNAVNLNPNADLVKLAQEFYSPENTKIIFYWLFSSFALFNIISFLFVLYNAVMTLDKVNPFAALWRMIKFSLRHIFGIIFLFIVVSVMNFFIHFILSLSSINIILSAIGLLLAFFYINYFVFLIFLYYERNKTKDNSNCGTKCDGEV